MSSLLGLVAASLLVSAPEIDDPSVDVSDYGFYSGELTTHLMKVEEPMAKLITKRVAESIFETNSSDEFLRRIHSLHSEFKKNPDLAERYQLLDGHLKREFDRRLKKAKTKRMLYAAGGAAIGALVAIPAGRLFTASTKLTPKTLLIAIPTGATVGAGAGFLLGQLLAMPHYQFNSNDFVKDLNLDLNALGDH